MWILTLYMLPIPILAHDGSAHVSRLELLVNGIGIVILAGCLLFLFYKLLTTPVDDDPNTD